MEKEEKNISRQYLGLASILTSTLRISILDHSTLPIKGGRKYKGLFCGYKKMIYPRFLLKPKRPKIYMVLQNYQNLVEINSNMIYMGTHLNCCIWWGGTES